MKVRKKPLVVDAMHLTPETIAEVKEWSGAKYWSQAPMLAWTGLLIQTLEGEMVAPYGHWIIRGIEGEFYPCAPGIFDATYEIVE